MAEETNFEQVLAHVQQHGRTTEGFRAQLALELRILAEFIHRQGNDTALEGLTKAAAGGALYCIKQLLGSFDDTQPDRLEFYLQRYCEVELQSYPHTPEDIEKMIQWKRKQSFMIRDIPVTCPDGLTRHIFASHQRQTTIEGRPYQEGEVIPFPLRFPPPFADVLGRIDEK